MRLWLYHRLCALDEVKIEKADQETVMEISIDPEAEQAFRALIAPTGFTLEQMSQMFLCWCVHYPEDATAWLKKAAEEQGVELEGEAEKGKE